MGFRTLPESSGSTLGWRIEGRLSDAEVAAMHGQLDTAIAASDSVRLLVDLSGLEGVEPAAVWEDLRRTFGKLDAIERMALLGDERWQEWLAGTSDALTPVEVQDFPAEQAAAAWDWLRSR
jgi:hypothetical protein